MPPEGAAAPAARQSRFRGLKKPPTVVHCVSLPAPRGGRCACGPAEPVPRPLLGKMAPTLPTFPFALTLRQAQDGVRKAYRRVPPEGVCRALRPSS